MAKFRNMSEITKKVYHNIDEDQYDKLRLFVKIR